MASIIQKQSLLLKTFKGEELKSYPYDTYDVCNSIINSYANWEPPEPAEEGKIEIYVPSLLQLAGNRYKDIGRTLEDWKREILHLCLYVDKLWIPDPSEFIALDIIKRVRSIGDIINQASLPTLSIHSDYFDDRNAIATLQTIKELTPLVESGILEFYPAQKTYMTAVAEQLFQERRGFTLQELEGAWPDLFVAEGLLYADYFNAAYVAMHGDELKAIKQELKKLSLSQPENISPVEVKLITALPKLQLPFFERLDATVLSQVRLNEQSFDDFRKILRDFSRELEAGLDQAGFEREVRLLEEDKLNPEIDKLLKEVSKTRSLGSSLSENGIDFGAGIIAGLAGSILGTPLSVAAAVGIGVTALSKALITTIIKQKQVRPAARVLYSFRSGRVPQPETRTRTRHWKLSAFNYLEGSEEDIQRWHEERGF